MFGLRNLHFAARDPWAGSTNLLGKTPYMSRKIIQITLPENTDLEGILVGMGSVAILQKRIIRTKEVLESKRTYHPTGVRFGETLFAAGTLGKFRTENTKAPAVFNHLADLWRGYELQ
jgi:hypothetical protein